MGPRWERERRVASLGETGSRNIWGGEGCLEQKEQRGQRQCMEAERPVRLDLRSKDESGGR